MRGERLTRRVVRGTLRRRLLTNAVVDPDEAAARLPAGLRPHVTPLGTVVGCCLLEIEHLRPAPLPASVGISQRAAAHRISVEWDDESGTPVVGVYVPARRTDSRLAVMLGGRWFPGVHRHARVDIHRTPNGFAWHVGDGGDFSIAAGVSVAEGEQPLEACDPIGGTCLGATVGLSPNHDGALEAARMEPERFEAREVVVENLASDFMSSFRTAQPAPAYLMQDVRVTWTPADPPRPAATAPMRTSSSPAG